MLDRETKAKIREAMASVAAQHGMSQRKLHELIRLQIEFGLKSPDAAVRSFWRRVPADGVHPTPEEAVGFLTAVRLGLIEL